MKRLLLVVPLLVLLLPGTARADNASQVAQALQNSPVYQAKGLDLVDVPGLQSARQDGDGGLQRRGALPRGRDRHRAGQP